jgi:hypothetical protein
MVSQKRSAENKGLSFDSYGELMVRRDRRVQQGADGRFFGRRVNCEQVPLLPAWAVAEVLDDPKKITYLMVWKSPADNTVQEAVHVAPHSETGVVEIRRQDGTSDFIRTVSRPLPRNGGKARFLICPCCQIPRRGLYGWEPRGRFTCSTVQTNWRCRVCNKLRYASEGGALGLRGYGAIAQVIDATYGRSRSDRPDQLLPLIFTSQSQVAGLNFTPMQ